MGATASYPIFAEEAVTLAEVQAQIAIMFRALGGEAVTDGGSRSLRGGGIDGWQVAGEEITDAAFVLRRVEGV